MYRTNFVEIIILMVLCCVRVFDNSISQDLQVVADFPKQMEDLRNILAKVSTPSLEDWLLPINYCPSCFANPLGG